MSSIESDTQKKFEDNPEAFRQERLNIPTIKYFWQASPLATNKAKSIPIFLRSMKVFEHLSDFELKIFSQFLHERNYTGDELVFKEGDSGFGFYIIFNGNIEVYSKKNKIINGETESRHQLITSLSKHEYFGELSLLEKGNTRNASAVSKGGAQLLAIYGPDMEEMIERHPVVGAKFLQALSIIVANRFNRVAEEVKNLKDKVIELECKLDKRES